KLAQRAAQGIKVLLDHNLPQRLTDYLPGHDVTTTRQMAWDELENGELLQAAANGNFGAFVSIDKNLEHEQNLSRLPIPVVVLDAPSNALPRLLPMVPFLQRVLS